MSYKQELVFAKEVALEAGKIMRRYFRADDIGTEWKEDDTPLTAADTIINDLVIEKVKSGYPDHGVWGEEASHNLGKEWMWVCDPIDGTMPFSAGLPISTFSLALTRNGVSQLGVVYDPYFDRMFHAHVNGGAYLNDKRIEVNDKNDLKNAMVDLEVWGTKTPDDDKIIPIDNVREELMEQGAKPFTLCSMVISGALVASGDFTGSIFGVRKPEDIAAIKVIVEEAGGKVTDLFGSEQKYDGLINGAIVSNGKVHDILVETIRELVDENFRD